MSQKDHKTQLNLFPNVSSFSPRYCLPEVQAKIPLLAGGQLPSIVFQPLIEIYDGDTLVNRIDPPLYFVGEEDEKGRTKALEYSHNYALRMVTKEPQRYTLRHYRSLKKYQPFPKGKEIAKNRIRDVRCKKNIGFDELSKALRIRAILLYDYENNIRQPSKSTIQRMADYLDCEAVSLVEEYKNPTKKEVKNKCKRQSGVRGSSLSLEL